MEAVFCYDILVVPGGETPDEHRRRLPLGLGDEVEAAVHAVDEIDVGCARRGVQGLGPLRSAVAVGVAGLVHTAHIGLRLRDAGGEGEPAVLPHQIFPHQRAGGLHGVPLEKALGQHGPAPFPMPFCHYTAFFPI